MCATVSCSAAAVLPPLPRARVSRSAAGRSAAGAELPEGPCLRFYRDPDAWWGLRDAWKGLFLGLVLVNKALTHEVKGLALKYRASARRAEAALDVYTLIIASEYCQRGPLPS